MTGFTVDFLGCKVSHTDAEAVRDALVAAGHTEDRAGAVRVVNTCCITAAAEKTSRQRVRRLLADPDARVFVTGCGASLRPGAYDDIDPRVTTLPGAAAVAAPAIVAAADALAGLACKGPAPGRNVTDRSRAFIKVQDGCSFSCSYCIVPTVRGSTRSRPVDAILDEVARRVARGQREMVITGVNVGLYRDDESRIGLPALLLRIADVPGVARVRISSIEVNHVSRRLVDAMAARPDIICPHLHVPLQSGSDAVLSDMRRHYRTRRYRAAIDHARERIPDLNLTTDIIVGYPTEDDARFRETLAFADELGFTKVHAFPFSPRPGTDAEADADPVPKAVKRERSALLRAQADEHARRRWASRVGSVDVIVMEHAGSRTGMTLTSGAADAAGSSAASAQHGGTPGGYTRDYCPVRIVGAAPASELPADGALARVSLIAADDHGLTAELLV